MTLKRILNILNNSKLPLSERDYEFVTSLESYITEKKYITERQASYICSIIRKNASFFLDNGIDRETISKVIYDKDFGIEIRKVTYKRPSVEYAGNGIFVFRNLYNIDYNTKFELQNIDWGNDRSIKYFAHDKSWAIKVTKETYKTVVKLIKDQTANYSDDVLMYLSMIDEYDCHDIDVYIEDDKIKINTYDDIYLNDLLKEIL